MHTTIPRAIAENLGDGCVVRPAALDDPDHGLTDEVLEETDVLTWWGHAAHHEVRDEVVGRRCSATCSPAWAWSSCTRH